MFNVQCSWQSGRAPPHPRSWQSIRAAAFGLICKTAPPLLLTIKGEWVKWKRERQTKGQKVTWKNHYSKPHQQYNVHWIFHSETHVLKDPEPLVHFKMAFTSVVLTMYGKPWLIQRRSWESALTYLLCWVGVEKAQIGQKSQPANIDSAVVPCCFC